MRPKWDTRAARDGVSARGDREGSEPVKRGPAISWTEHPKGPQPTHPGPWLTRLPCPRAEKASDVQNERLCGAQRSVGRGAPPVLFEAIARPLSVKIL